MQVFQKRDAWLGGMDEAIAILKLCSHDWEALTVHALYDGDPIEPWETVMTIEGDYTLFAHLETVYLGVLARRTLVTTNVVEVLQEREAEAGHLHAGAARPLARPDGRRLCGLPRGAGRAALPVGVTTDEQASWWGGKGVGTVPHSLIAAYGGDTVLAARTFADWAPDGPQHHRAGRFRQHTPSRPRSRSRARSARGSGACGSTPPSRSSTRRSGTSWATSSRRASTSGSSARCATALDAEGFEHVRIVVSGGFTAEKIRAFEEAGRAGRRVRRRLVADPRRERLHRRRRDDRRRAVGEGRAPAAARTRGWSSST